MGLGWWKPGRSLLKHLRVKDGWVTARMWELRGLAGDGLIEELAE